MDSRIVQGESHQKAVGLSLGSIYVMVEDNGQFYSKNDNENTVLPVRFQLTSLEIEAANRHERNRLKRNNKSQQLDFEEFLNNRQESQHTVPVSSSHGLNDKDGRKSVNQKARRNAVHVSIREAGKDNTTAGPDTNQHSMDHFRERRTATCDAVDTTRTERTRQRVFRRRLTLKEIDCQSGTSDAPCDPARALK